MVKNIVSNAKAIGNRAGIADILARTAASGTLDGTAMIIKLERDPNRFSARLRGKGGHHRRINSARHRDNNALWCIAALQLKQIVHDERL